MVIPTTGCCLMGLTKDGRNPPVMKIPGQQSNNSDYNKSGWSMQEKFNFIKYLETIYIICVLKL